MKMEFGDGFRCPLDLPAARRAAYRGDESMAQPTAHAPVGASRERQSMFIELQERLRKAEAVLRSLYEAKLEADRQAVELKRADAMKAVTGSSAIERAIHATSRIVERLKREVGEARRSLTQQATSRFDAAGELSLLG